MMTSFHEGVNYVAFKSIFHEAHDSFSSIVKFRSNPFLEPNGT